MRRPGVLTWSLVSLPPLAWALHTVWAYAVAGDACGSSDFRFALTGLAAVAAFAAMAAGALSLVRSPAGVGEPSAEGGRPRALLVAIAVGLGLVLGAAVLVQGAATIALTGCER